MSRDNRRRKVKGGSNDGCRDMPALIASYGKKSEYLEYLEGNKQLTDYFRKKHLSLFDRIKGAKTINVLEYELAKASIDVRRDHWTSLPMAM